MLEHPAQPHVADDLVVEVVLLATHRPLRRRRPAGLEPLPRPSPYQPPDHRAGRFTRRLRGLSQGTSECVTE